MMCLLALAYKRKITREGGENAFRANPDGAGVGWRIESRTHIVKGFITSRDFLSFYDEFDVVPHIVHFRLGTSGGRCPELTHPFVVSLTSPLVTEWSGKEPILANNGIVHGWEDTFLRFLPDVCRELRRRGRRGKIPPGPWSDTRAAAVIAALVGDEILEFLGGKGVVLGSKIRLYRDFVYDNGVYFSNPSYRSQAGRAGFTWTPWQARCCAR